jgi:hypothetical protein
MLTIPADGTQARPSQEVYSKGLGLIAAMRSREAADLRQAFNQEISKLGAAASGRVDAVTHWLNAMGGEDAAALTRAWKSRRWPAPAELRLRLPAAAGSECGALRKAERGDHRPIRCQSRVL